ncbi:ABC transporter permease [Streptomyces malaysiensis]|uniref:ABC transporter permease n=1 Tax=Streptomyces malaysiensis subsp. samsunensis TaxID=459658 RepID=A0A9X2RTR1_STRMQ|nr:ABC transporter permease [Streptomyces samsunensis]MCQ8830038.1 ABC transporter permease [Streptomyces samsunensis]
MTTVRRIGWSGLLIAVVLGWSVRPSLFTRRDPNEGVLAERLRAPSGSHWFGTDELGRDLYARVVHGAGLSLSAAALAVGIALVSGALLGVVAGSAGGWTDDAVMRVVDMLLAVPHFLLSLAIITILGFGTVNVAVAVGLSATASFARMTRGEVLRVRRAAYVEAATVAGTGRATTLARHILPNAARPVLALSSLELGNAILAMAALSFLGFAAPPPAADWGSLVAAGRDYLEVAWWMTTVPGLAIVVSVIAANQLGRRLADRGGRR